MHAPHCHPTLGITVCVPVRNLNVIAVDHSQVFDRHDAPNTFDHVPFEKGNDVSDISRRNTFHAAFYFRRRWRVFRRISTTGESQRK